MREGPDIARIAALIGDPARAHMLTALMSGKALTATELAGEAGVTLQTASGHLSKLLDGQLVQARKQGRHKYFALAHADVAATLEALMGLAAGQGTLRTRTGPKDAAMRQARVCYNHLAGRMGVQMFTSMLDRDLIWEEGEALGLTGAGEDFVTGFGVDLGRLEDARAPLCRSCLDWSERRTHLAGSLGRAMLARMEDTGWLRRDTTSRAIHFSASGQSQFDQAFPSIIR
ncbi:winged helix-turn-helix domain-containing protein [Cognatiyoonia sp. IB215446]|uniref:ArsR/SmtB family transcription factor n=1 Tax=Cognatiyoonia sp. IB215446 TaxID=3097355 RepID=UPI002A1205FE|nr:winged helix-turn-helix domain-containing protein [Cognatiyoonia sp. IB215446]MDX8348411.1 winged helix-turn-helix domain-containing protein [Cognatiyoonia sp. IB215446]